MSENLELDVSKALLSLEALDKKIDVTISKLDKLYGAAGKTAAPKISYEENTLNRQLELRKQIEAKINSYQLQLSRGEAADARRLANLQQELSKMASLGQLYAAISEQARKVGENLGTGSLKFRQLTDIAAQFKGQMDEISTTIKKGASNMEQLALAKANAAKDYSDTGIQAAQASKVNTAAKKTELLATNELVGAYDRLVAKYQIAQREALNLAVDENATAEQRKKASQSAAQYANQLGNAANAVNQLGGRAEKGIPAMYSFQQILLETPNAALGARTYVMSLSNNLPMFIMQMQNLAMTTDLQTKKVLGWAGALKVLKGSMGWISLAMVAISTVAIVLTNNWDKITAAVRGTSKAYEDATGAYGEYSKLLRSGGGSVAQEYSKILLLGAAIKRYKENVDGTARSQKNINGIIDLTNNTLGTYFGKVNSITGAMKAYAEEAQRYIEWTINMAVATKQADNVASVRLARLGIEQELEAMGLSKQQIGKIDNAVAVSRINIKKKTTAELLEIAKDETSAAKKDAKEKDNVDLSLRGKLIANYKDELVQLRKATTSDAPGQEAASSIETLLRKEGGIIATTDKVEAAILFRKQLMDNEKESIDVLNFSMDDLVAKDKKVGRSSGLSDFVRELINFDYASETLGKIRDYYKAIAEDENASYEDRLRARDIYDKAARELTITAANKNLADITSQYQKEQEADNRKLEKNKKRIVKGANDEILVYADRDEEILKQISNFNQAYNTLDEKGQKELLNRHTASIRKEISDLQDRAGKVTTNEKAYLLARATNLSNYLGKVTDSSIKLTNELQSLTYESIRLTGSIELGKMEKFLKDIKDTGELEDAKDNIKSLEESIARLQKRMSDSAYNPLENFKYEMDNDIQARRESLRKALNEAEDVKKALDKVKETREGLMGESYSKKELTKLGLDTGVIDEISVQNKLYEQGKISRETYEKAIARIIANYQGKNADNLKAYGSGVEQQVTSLNQQILDKEKEQTLALDKVQATRLKNYQDSLEKLAKMQEEAAERTKQMAKDLLNGVTGTLTEFINIQKDNYTLQLDNEQKRADKKKEILLKELEVDGLTTEEKETNERKKAEINDWYAAQEADRTAKKEAAEKQAAQTANQLAIVQAGIDLAMTLADIRMKQTLYASALASNPLTAAAALPTSFALFAPMYALATAAGAMKIAALSAKKFAEGGHVNEDMMAWVGDANKHEYGVTKEGNIFMTPDRPTLVPLAKDTVIYKDQETFLSKYMNAKVTSDISRARQLSYKKELSELTSVIKRVEENTRSKGAKANKYYGYIR